VSTRWAREAAMACRRAPNAQTIVLGDVSVIGPVQEEDRVMQDASGSESLRRVTVAVVPTDALGTVARHSTATIGRWDYVVRDVQLASDGELTELVLSRVAT
jgi:hypothetical protein